MSNCTARFALASDFAAFFCIKAILSRVHDGAANAAVLTDSQADFIENGIEANQGMILYNVTDGSSGVVTAVTENTLTTTLASGTDNDWDVGDIYRITALDSNEIATIENVLDIAASDIHAALAASGACDCTLAGWARAYLKKLNIIDASAFYVCECAKPKLTDEQRQAYLEWADRQFELIRTQKLELCSGATGAEFPAIDWVEQGTTEFAQAQIVDNDIHSE